MRKSISRITGLLVVGFALLLALGAGLAQEEAQPVFRIGVLDFPRGPISSGAQLAVSEINQAGGVEGADGTMFRLELVIESTETGDTLAEAIDRLDNAGVIAVLGPEHTESALSNLPLLQSLNVPVLTPAIGDTVVASDPSGMIFRPRAAERWLGSALADYLVTELNAVQITTVQLDRFSTAARVGFSVALDRFPNRPQETVLLLEHADGLGDLVVEVVEASPQVVTAFGPPELAAGFYTLLRASDWIGIFAYHQAESRVFREAVPLDELHGVIGTTTWPLSATDSASSAFLSAYVRTVGDIPGPAAAASYDAVYLLAEAIRMPGDMVSNLQAVRDFPGVQGRLNPGGLPERELSNSTAVIQLNIAGGFSVGARYAGAQRLTDEAVEVVAGEPTPTPTPEGVEITIRSARQNVRTGPGLEYDVLGQMSQGEQARVIGATIDFSWVVIEYRGQQGFLATYLLDVFGDRAGIPVVAPPPTPTPGPATATPTAIPYPDLIIAAAAPSNITWGMTTAINVTVANIGSRDAGQFAIAGTFPPDDYFTAATVVGGLPAGAERVVQLPVTLQTSTGNYEVIIVADLNQEVDEGPGEANNWDFIFRYKVDRQLILINNTTLTTGATLDLEGGFTPDPDVRYDAGGLTTVSGCTGTEFCIGLLSPALNWDTSHYDAITAANGINTNFIPNSALTPGATIGVLTSDGRRGVMRVDAINPGVSITLTFRLYQ
jgi:branched-chain amino acid transport system substrate-binding protein